jgi:hypothetical protein
MQMIKLQKSLDSGNVPQLPIDAKYCWQNVFLGVAGPFILAAKTRFNAG